MMNNGSQQFYEKKYNLWDDMKVHGPASRHTRRIILKWLEDLYFSDVIDISCGGGQLLIDIRNKFGSLSLTGTEFTRSAIETNKNKVPDINFEYFNIELDAPLNKRDLVLCIDVLEHIADDQAAINKLGAMTSKYLLIAVPLGRLTHSDKISLGHLHGYSKKEIIKKLSMAGFNIKKTLNWGFPFYSITRFFNKGYTKNLAEGRVTHFKKTVFNFLYLLYFINLPFIGGRLFVLCEPLNSYESSIK